MNKYTPPPVHFIWTNPSACPGDGVREVTFNSAAVTCPACKANAKRAVAKVAA
jgi:hypothetical protein